MRRGNAPPAAQAEAGAAAAPAPQVANGFAPLPPDALNLQEFADDSDSDSDSAPDDEGFVLL
jgi:hypothetical protein